MIIVPAEKQFAWHHAPVTLFCLVLINVFVYFFYQLDDAPKFSEAYTLYFEGEFLEIEWPLYQDYLIETGEEPLLEQLRQFYAHKSVAPIIYSLLLDQQFYEYLQQHQSPLTDSATSVADQIKRQQIQDIIQSTSALAFGLQPSNWKVYSLVTHQFLHGDIMHLLGNMFFLIVCGFAVEAAIGPWAFLLFYLFTGVAGGLTHTLVHPDSTASLIGASGAVSGVMAMYLAIFRLRQIEFFYWFICFVGYFRAPALLILPFYIGREIYSFYMDADSNIAFMAHAGGFAAGALIMVAALTLRPAMLNREYVDKKDTVSPYRLSLADIYANIEKFQFMQALTSIQSLIKKEGINYELAVLNYNLQRIYKNENFNDAVWDLFQLPLMEPKYVQTIDKAWRDNPEVREHIDQRLALKIGLQLAELESLSSAEQVFQQLANQECKSPIMAKYAEKLAQSHASFGEASKHAKYAELAKYYRSTTAAR